MLFNSPEFILYFLPLTLAGFFIAGAIGRQSLAVMWLAAASLFFYAWWRADYIPLFLASIAANYAVGTALAQRPRAWLLAAGIAGNLAVLGWFKYADFLAQAANDIAGLGLSLPHVILPLAISFYTFQQIAYLVDAHAGETLRTGFSRYLLFIVFFPHLIAGPILHHREMLEQFRQPGVFRPRATDILLGVTAFTIGLFKKVCIADPMVYFVSLAFAPAAEGVTPGFVDAWIGALAYALQLYFDFSGYSDMAVGLALMFGIRLPINFNSPYKAASIIEFWQRWHMTLTRFLTAYVYTPLVAALARRRARAGKPLFNRSAPALGPFVVLVAGPTLVTMGLAGIWHGAGWQFVVFGLLHGGLLVANHAWRSARRVAGIRGSFGWPGRLIGIAVTFPAVALTLVFFKAGTLDQALLIVNGMAGLGGATLSVLPGPQADASVGALVGFAGWRLVTPHGLLFACALAIVWALPNTSQYLELIAEPIRRRVAEAQHIVRWQLDRVRLPGVRALRPNFVNGGIIGILLCVALLRALTQAPTEFLYFTF